MEPKYKPIVGISIGDVNGIGAELILRVLSHSQIFNLITPVVYGNVRVLSYYKKALRLDRVQYQGVDSIDKLNSKGINVINSWNDEVKITMGQPTKQGGAMALKAFADATEDLKAGKIDALVTAPINKKSVSESAPDFSGHTEYIAAATNTEHPLMLLVNEGLRVGLVTNHEPVNKVASLLTQELIIKKASIFYNSLKKDFLISKPKLAVLGLNPHAGEEGNIGTEEIDVITPAIKALKEKGMMVYGPFPADGFFGSANHKNFDGVLAMYHDQGLAPFKALSFGEGVNYTAGLPVIRTSPDHGTAYDITGKGIASESSLRAAIFLAVDIFKNRKEMNEMTANPLKKQAELRREY